MKITLVSGINFMPDTEAIARQYSNACQNNGKKTAISACFHN